MGAPDAGNRIVHGMPRSEYDALSERVNWSTLKHMGKSPAHYRHALLSPTPDTDPRKLGRAVHLAVLEPERFGAEVVMWSGGTRRGKTWEDFKAAHAEQEILKEDEIALCHALQAAARSDPVAAPYLSGGRGEVTVLWRHVDEDPGGWLPEWKPIDMKGRLDFVSTGQGMPVIVDLKTTRDGSPSGFGREIWKYQYHMQAALYQDAYHAVTGARLPYVLVAVESAAPHVVQVYRLNELQLSAGRDAYRTLLRRLAMCRTEAKWPGYNEAEMDAEFPKWSGLADDDEDFNEMGLEIEGHNGDE